MNAGRHSDNFASEPIVTECKEYLFFEVLRYVESIYDIIFSNEGQGQGQM